MKKLFAILAVLVLFGTYAWAQDVTNNFTVNVKCKATEMYNTTENLNIGDITAGQAKIYTAARVDWDFQNRGVDNDGEFSASFALTDDGGFGNDNVEWSVGYVDLTAGTGTNWTFDNSPCNAEGKLYVQLEKLTAPAGMTAGTKTITFTLTWLDN